MGKLAQATSKYTIYAKFDAEGIVEKPDVIGAVFGQLFNNLALGLGLGAAFGIIFGSVAEKKKR